MTTRILLLGFSLMAAAFGQDAYIITTPADFNNTSIGTPHSALADAAGNLYIAVGNLVRKVSPDGSFVIVAGTNLAGYNGDGRAANTAQLRSPQGMALDSLGNLYIADFGNDRVRMVTPAGMISTVAGGGSGSDGGLAVGARVESPTAVAVDAAGNLYITTRYQIRKVSGGIITTVMNQRGYPGFTGDGGPATLAQASLVTDLKLDTQGNIYFVDTGNSRVRKISQGIITTIAGGTKSAYNGDLQPAVGAWLSYPTGVAVDNAGNVYISDRENYRIREVSPQGTITTIAGTGVKGYFGDGGSATLAQLFWTGLLSVDNRGNIYFADESRIRKLSPMGIAPGGVVNAASGRAGAVAPGEILGIFGTSLGPERLLTWQLNTSGLVATTLGGTEVKFDGISAPILFVQANQVNVIVPYEVAGRASVSLTVTYNGFTTTAVTLPVTACAPAIFAFDGSGRGPGAIVNQDGTINAADHPALAGNVIVLYATGEGQTLPGGVNGSIATGALSKPVAPVFVTIGGLPAQVLYAGGAPGLIAGVMQVNVLVPSGVAPGNLPVVLTMGSVASPSGVTVVVR